MDFGRIPKWNCPIAGQPNRGGNRPNRVQEPKKAPKSAKPWYVPPIQCHEPSDGVFFAQIGPTGGNQGYASITGMCLCLTVQKLILTLLLYKHFKNGVTLGP